uniref:Uncharacterized protein n=1 Tax=Arundo donax TaxID=35708 RepID=A0A0A9HGS1_ARUDO
MLHGPYTTDMYIHIYLTPPLKLKVHEKILRLTR